MAYIDRESLKLKVRRYLMPNVDDDGTVSVENAERYFLKLLDDEPSAEVEEVRHARWLHGMCTNCGHEALDYLDETLGGCIMRTYITKRCPTCGAKMDGQKNDFKE